LTVIDETHVAELLRVKDGRIYHREGQELEFKESFNFAGLAEYLRDFAAFANNRGGYMVFGVTDSPRRARGLSANARDMFDRIDLARISGFLIDLFSPEIRWEQMIVHVGGKPFGVFYIHKAAQKPIIARKDEGKDQLIKSGEIYYRYGGRTQKIQFAELESIISHRIRRNNEDWLGLMERIGRVGPSRAAVLDTESALLGRQDSQVLVVDEALAEKLQFVREGQFDQINGEPTLKLVGDVVPVDRVEVVRREKEHLTKAYPLSAMEVVTAVKKALPQAKQNEIWEAIKENELKGDSDYSAYVFRNKKQEDAYEETGILPAGLPCIYNQSAVDFLIRVLRA